MQTVLLRRSLGLQEQVGLREGQHNRTAKAQPFMQHVCSPDGGMQLHSSGTGCSDNQPQREDASTTGPLYFLAVPNYQLISPHPLNGKEIALAAAGIPMSYSSPAARAAGKWAPSGQPPVLFPKSAHAPAICKFLLQSLLKAVLSPPTCSPFAPISLIFN